jgi:CheY-like chemotaxis protein
MRTDAYPMRPAPIGLLGTLRSWFAAEAREVWPPALEPARCAPRPPPHSYGAVRVLVADDNPVNLMVIAAMLESRGLFPLLAADGAEAVALACEMPFDLILMDLQMPILDGLSATAAIRRFEHAAGRPAVPVVAYSSALPAAAVLAAYGINGSLFKPCEDQDLEDCLVLWCPPYRAAPPVDGCGWARTEPSMALRGRLSSGL